MLDHPVAMVSDEPDDESDFEEISGTEADKGQEEAVPAGETFLDRVA